MEGETNSLHGSLSRDLFKIDAQISSFGTTVAHTGNGRKEMKAMKPWNGMLAALLLIMFVASSCATLSPPVVEQEEEEDSIQKWLEWQDMDLWRPWRSLDH